MANICHECENPAWTGKTIEAPALPSGGEGGTSNFNALENRPKYDGMRMTGNTDIPNTARDVERLDGDITDIQELIPETASTENQLADKEFVNSSVATNTANFVGTFNSLEELEAVENPSNNDYGFVISTDEQGNTVYNRYKYVASVESWEFEYALNNSSFTAAQWAAINSGITEGNVEKLNAILEITSIGNGLVLENNGQLRQKLYTETGNNTDAAMDQKTTSEAIDAVYGHARVLTEADYNIKSGTWSTSDPTTFDAVALWLMPSGLYLLADNNLLVYIDRNNRVFNVPSGGKSMLVLNAQTNDKIIIISSGTGRMYVCYTTSMGYGNEIRGNLDSRTVLTRYEIENSLTSSDYEKILSAKQGKVLNEKIGNFSDLVTTDKSSVVGAINDAVGQKGQAKVLTADDYNWNSVTQTTTGTLDTVALWLLEPGYYTFDGTTVNVKASKASGEMQTNYAVGAIVSATGENGYKSILLFGSDNGYMVPWTIRGVSNTGQIRSGYGVQNLLTSGMIDDRLDSTNSLHPLSANQGKALKGLIDKKQDKLTAGNGIEIDNQNVISIANISAEDWSDLWQ